MRDLICPAMCRYHKPDKVEDPGCGGVEWLQKRPQLRRAVAQLTPWPENDLHHLSPDDPRLWAICQQCEFRIDGCDFRDPQVPDEDCSPCGGLKAVAGLLAAGLNLDLP